MINQSIQIFQTITAGIFGGARDEETKDRDQIRPSINGASADEGDASSILYCETEYNAFDNKMHPTKIVEKHWVDNYKLAQLIDQQ